MIPLDRLEALEPGRPLGLGVLTPAAAVRLGEMLGRGEVAFSVAGRAEIRESVFPGVWHVREAVGGETRHTVEAAEMPRLLDGYGRAALRSRPVAPPAPEGAINAPLLLREIALCLEAGGETVINLTNLPVNAADLAHLDACLGDGAVTGEAAGYGACRFAATGVHRVWRVRYFNADDTLLIDSIEIGAVPLAARAQPEDLADGLAGLRERVAAEREMEHA